MSIFPYFKLSISWLFKILQYEVCTNHASRLFKENQEIEKTIFIGCKKLIRIFCDYLANCSADMMRVGSTTISPLRIISTNFI
ncbi:MAG: hypothetical protein V4628_13830 [Pseudomonadota bacterium]